MQSTEKESRTQKDLASRLNAEAEWMLVDPSDWMKIQADLLNEAATALAAERDRADMAEARLAIVWDEGYDASSTDWDNGGPGDPNPYRSEATV